MSTRLLLMSLVVMAFPTGAISQHVQWSVTGWPRLGIGIAIVNDMDGDGDDDLVTGVRVPDGTSQGRREVWSFSSRDGTPLPQRLLEPPGDVYNLVTQAGDFDGDGWRDFLLHGGYQGQPGIHAISGRTWTRLFRLPGAPGVSWAYSLAADLDVNGDQRPDIVLTVPGLVSVEAYDHTGSLLYVTQSLTPGVVWGPGINRFPDFDGDGCDDFVVGIGELTTAGGAEIVSGRTGLSLRRVIGPTPGDYIGMGVAACDDLDGDGRPDIAAGGGAIGSPGSVQVFSSASGQRLHGWYTGGYYDSFGEYILGNIDLDQDGVGDVVASAFGEPVSPLSNMHGTLHAYSGRDGTRLMRFADTAGGSNTIGPALALPFSPRRGSVLPRFLASGIYWGYEPTTLPFYRGKLWMFEGGPDGVHTIAPPCRGTLGKEPRMGLRALGATGSRVTVSHADAGTLAFLVLGLSPSPAPLDLAPFGLPSCSLHPTIYEIGVSVTGTSGLAAGYAAHDFGRPFTAAATGLQVVGQWLVLGPGAHWPGGTTATLQWRLL